MTQFGPALRAIRERHRLSQPKFAERLDCDHSYVSRLESGSRFPSREFVEQTIRNLRLTDDEANTLLVAGGWLPDAARGRAAADPLLLDLGEILWDPALPRDTFGQMRATLRFLVTSARLAKGGA